MMTALDQTLTRTIVIRATRETVFRYFTDSQRWATWWGKGSTIDARPGGALYIRYPEGTEAVGTVLEVRAPERIVFTYGYVRNEPVPPGGSQVTIQLDEHEDGTRLQLRHDFADAAVRDHHVQGWRYQLSVFSHTVANEVNANVAAIVDAWYGAWATADDVQRTAALQAIAGPAIQFRDRFSAIDGLDELVVHIGAALRFMPGVRLERAGDVRHCQGTALSDWTAVGPDGAARGAGTTVFSLDQHGRITSAVGLWK